MTVNLMKQPLDSKLNGWGRRPPPLVLFKLKKHLWNGQLFVHHAVFCRTLFFDTSAFALARCCKEQIEKNMNILLNLYCISEG